MFEIYIPQAMVKLKKNVAWSSSGTTVAIKKRNGLFHVAKYSGRPSDHAKYSIKRNIVYSVIAVKD